MGMAPIKRNKEILWPKITTKPLDMLQPHNMTTSVLSELTAFDLEDGFEYSKFLFI